MLIKGVEKMEKTIYFNKCKDYKVTESMKNYHRVLENEKNEIQSIADLLDSVEVNKKEGYRVYKGRRKNENELNLNHNLRIIISKILNFKKVNKWSSEPYRRIYINEEVKAIFTFCEGDLSLKVFDSKKGYKKFVDYCNNFYLN